MVKTPLETISVKASKELKNAYKEMAYQLRYDNFSNFVRDSMTIGCLCLASGMKLDLSKIPIELVQEDIVSNPSYFDNNSDFIGTSPVLQELYKFLNIEDIMANYLPGSINLIGIDEEEFQKMESIAQALGYENAQQWFNSKEYIDYLCEKIKQLKLDTYEEELSE